MRLEQQSMKMKSSCAGGILRTKCKHWSYSLIFDYAKFWFNDSLVYNSSWRLDWPCSHLPGCQFLTSWHPTVPNPHFSPLLTSEASCTCGWEWREGLCWSPGLPPPTLALLRLHSLPGDITSLLLFPFLFLFFSFSLFLPLFHLFFSIKKNQNHIYALSKIAQIPPHFPFPRNNHFQLFQLILLVFTFVSLKNSYIHISHFILALGIIYWFSTLEDEDWFIFSHSSRPSPPHMWYLQALVFTFA